MPRPILSLPTDCGIRCCSLLTKPVEMRFPLPLICTSGSRTGSRTCIRETWVQPDLTFDLSGQANGKKPYWGWDYRNLAPRLAIAYSPHASSGFFHKLFGDAGKSSIRAGYGLYFDHFGEGVVNTFDAKVPGG